VRTGRPQSPGTGSCQSHFSRRSHGDPPSPPTVHSRQSLTHSFLPHLPVPSPGHPPQTLPHTVTHRRNPYPECRLLVRLPAPVRWLVSSSACLTHTVPQRQESRSPRQPAQPHKAPARRSEPSPVVLPLSGIQRMQSAAQRSPGSALQVQSPWAPGDDVTGPHVASAPPSERRPTLRVRNLS
jgi:hypothetical protein